jgi:hypothetical protein
LLTVLQRAALFAFADRSARVKTGKKPGSDFNYSTGESETVTYLKKIEV